MTSPGDGVIANAHRHRELFDAMSDQRQTISVRATSRDGSVIVEADGLGSLTGLWLTPSANRLPPDILADLIVDTAQGAARVASERYGRVLAEFTSRIQELQTASN